MRSALGLACALAAGGCGDAGARRTAAETGSAERGAAARAPHADSLYATAVVQFREGLAVPTGLEGGAPSREALVRRFVDALAAGDAAALRALLLTRAEFAHLVYPSSPYVRAPYRQAPQVTWLLLASAGDKGLRRLGERLAGRPLAYRAHACGPPLQEGANRLWRGCSVTVALRGRSATSRLFGVIVERGGRFKFASYDNDL